MPFDPINIPERHVRWVNFYRDKYGLVYGGPHFHSREDADEYEFVDKDARRIACKLIEFEEGEGLEPVKREESDAQVFFDYVDNF